MARRAKSTITTLDVSDIKALQKIEDDADNISKEKFELYNAYKQSLSEYSVNYLKSHIDLMFDMIDYANINVKSKDYDHAVYKGTPFIEHELREISFDVKSKGSTKTKDFFAKPLGIFNITEYEESDVFARSMLNIVGVTLIDDGKNYLCEFPYMPYFYIASGDMDSVHTNYMLVPLSRLMTMVDTFTSVEAVSKIYCKYVEDMNKIQAKVTRYTVNTAIEKYPSSW